MDNMKKKKGMFEKISAYLSPKPVKMDMSKQDMDKMHEVSESFMGKKKHEKDEEDED